MHFDFSAPSTSMIDGEKKKQAPLYSTIWRGRSMAMAMAADSVHLAIAESAVESAVESGCNNGQAHLSTDSCGLCGPA